MKFYYQDYNWKDLQTTTPFFLKSDNFEEILAAQELGFRLMLVKNHKPTYKIRLVNNCMCIDWIQRVILNNENLMEDIMIIMKLEDQGAFETRLHDFIHDFLQENIEKTWDELEYYLMDKANTYAEKTKKVGTK